MLNMVFCMRLYLRHRGLAIVTRKPSLDPMLMVWLVQLIIPLYSHWPSNSMSRQWSNLQRRKKRLPPPHLKLQLFLRNILRREINSLVGKRRKGRRVRVIKTSRNPRIMLMGVRRIRRRWSFPISCVREITWPMNSLSLINIRSCLKTNNRLS